MKGGGEGRNVKLEERRGVSEVGEQGREGRDMGRSRSSDRGKVKGNREKN